MCFEFIMCSTADVEHLSTVTPHLLLLLCFSQHHYKVVGEDAFFGSDLPSPPARFSCVLQERQDNIIFNPLTLLNMFDPKIQRQEQSHTKQGVEKKDKNMKYLKLRKKKTISVETQNEQSMYSFQQLLSFMFRGFPVPEHLKVIIRVW